MNTSIYIAPIRQSPQRRYLLTCYVIGTKRCLCVSVCIERWSRQKLNFWDLLDSGFLPAGYAIKSKN